MDHREDDAVLGSLAPALAATALPLARRFAAGATMWCWSPDHPEQAQHVAVEFVHPVIVGKRALPAVAVGGGVDRLRPLVAPAGIGVTPRGPAMSPMLVEPDDVLPLFRPLP